MKEEKKLREYCEKMHLDCVIENRVLQLDGHNYQIVDEDTLLFDEEMNFLPSLEDEGCIGHVFEFGGRWYYQEYGEEVDLIELKYIGKAKTTIPTPSFLGIHSGYELRNGIGLYGDWIKKAKFLGTTTLGMCEKNTLSGVLLFQQACKKAGIKSVIGLSVTVQGKEKYDIKIYAKSFKGWTNLLKFNAEINLHEKVSVTEEFLNNNVEECVVIADPKTLSYENIPECVDYYQLETVNFLNEEKDKWFLSNLEKYMLGDIDPISITDAYYLEESEYVTREQLWAISKSYEDRTDNQFFKTKAEYAKELKMMFENGSDTWIDLFKEAVANEAEMIEKCKFEYDTNTRHLPKYKMTEEEAEHFDTNRELFLHLIRKGFKTRGIEDPKYIERVKEEIRVLEKGDVIDYFLVLHDIINFAKKNKLLTGIGRGSAGGSLVSYLLGLIQINPMEFDLLFERFLNDGRMGVLEDRPSFKFVGEDGEEIELKEGTLVRVKNLKGEEEVVFVRDVKEGMEILDY